MRKIIIALIFLGLMFCNMGNASGTNYEIVKQVDNDGQTNFVGTNYLPTNDNDPNWSGWTPLQVGDTFSSMDDFGQPAQIPVGAKLPKPTPVSSMNQDFFHHAPLNTIPRETRSVSTQLVVSAPVKSSVTAPVAQTAPVNYNTVRQVQNDGPTNFVGTNYLPPDDSGTVWTPLQVGDTFPGVDDFGNPVAIIVGPKLVLQKRSTVNSWLTLSRNGEALRVIN